MKMLKQAAVSDCNRFTTVQRLRDTETFRDTPILELVEVASDLRDSRQQFIDSIDALSHRIRFYRKIGETFFKCPYCGDPYCVNSEVFVRQR